LVPKVIEDSYYRDVDYDSDEEEMEASELAPTVDGLVSA
jgi:hypothetical protein